MIEQEGFTLDGIVQVMVFCVVPTCVPELVYVYSVRVTWTVVPVVFSAARPIRGVQAMLVAVV